MLNMYQNKRILSEMKHEMIRLYVKLSIYLKKRDTANTKIYERKIREMEKLFTDRHCRAYVCGCDSDEDSDDAYEKYLHGKTPNCIGCMRRFVERERLRYPLLLDGLNWGLTGVLESQRSEESIANTSTDEDSPKSSSYARHKALRKLWRQGPDKLQSEYFTVGVEPFQKTEAVDKEVNKTSENISEAVKLISDTEAVEDSQNEIPISESAKHLSAERNRRKQANPTCTEHFDDFARRIFKVSSDFQLKKKYSDDRFSLVAAIINELQQYLTRYPDRCYPNVSELILLTCVECSSFKEALGHYYRAIYNRSKKAIVEPESTSETSTYEPLKPKTSHRNLFDKVTGNLKSSTVEIIATVSNGTLNLSERGLLEVPSQVWTFDKTPLTKIETAAKAVDEKRVRPLECLDLSGNSLTYINPDGSCFDTLTVLKLAGNNIAKLPVTFKRFSCLTDVDVANNQLTKIPKSICRIVTLKNLNASDNHIESVPDELGNLSGLITLDLRWNQLKSLPESLSQIRFLKVLNVGYNKLRELPLNMKRMTDLIVLDVSFNKLTELPSLTGLVSMIVLNASGNYIKRFPDLSECKSLYEIRMDGNRIKRVSSDYMTNVPVVQFTLSHNKLLKLPDDFYRFETLVLLDLTANRLTWLPWSLGRLKYLSCVKVELNRIRNVRIQDIKEGSKRIMEVLLRNLLFYEGDEEAIAIAKKEAEVMFLNVEAEDLEHEWLPNENILLYDEDSYKNVNLAGKPAVPIGWLEEFKKRNVSCLDLSRNQMGWLPYQLTMLAKSLEKLYARNNCFKSIPDFISKLKHLTVLDISQNHLNGLPLALEKCPLIELLCAFNEFTDIPKVVFQLKALTRLDFSNNSIESIRLRGLKRLKHLKVLNLHGNEIKQLPSGLGYIESIKELDVGENLFKYPEKSVLDNGTDEIMAYLRKHDDYDILYKYAEEIPRKKDDKKKMVSISKDADKFYN